MNATTQTLLMAALAAILTSSAAAADDGQDAANGERPCDFFVYSVDPPGYHLDPSCPPLPLPLFDNSP